MSSSLLIWCGRECLGLVLHMFAANAVNASSEIMRVFWNFGSGSYALVMSCVSYINTSWGCVISLISANGALSSRIFCLPGTCAGLLIVVNFVLTRPLSSPLFLTFYPMVFYTNQVP